MHVDEHTWRRVLGGVGREKRQFRNKLVAHTRQLWAPLKPRYREVFLYNWAKSRVPWQTWRSISRRRTNLWPQSRRSRAQIPSLASSVSTLSSRWTARILHAEIFANRSYADECTYINIDTSPTTCTCVHTYVQCMLIHQAHAQFVFFSHMIVFRMSKNGSCRRNVWRLPCRYDFLHSYTDIWKHKYVYVQLSTDLCMYVHIHLIHVYMCICVDVYMFIYICMYIYIYTHVYMYIYTHICIHGCSADTCTHTRTVYVHVYMHMYIHMMCICKYVYV